MTFHPRIHEETGNVCCAAYTTDGEPIPSPSQCDKCTAHFAALGLRMKESPEFDAPAPPPDPYARGLAALRAASATPESLFEDAWKAARRAEFDAEYARRNRHDR